MKKQKFKKRWLIAPGIVLGLGILIGVPTTTILLTQQQNNNKNPTSNQNDPMIQTTPKEEVKDDSNQDNKNLMDDSNKENKPNESLKNDDSMNPKPSESKTNDTGNPTPQNQPKESDNVSPTPNKPSSNSQPIREEGEVENGTTSTSPKPKTDESRPNEFSSNETDTTSSQGSPNEPTSPNETQTPPRTNENVPESNTSTPTNDVDDQGSSTENEPPSSDSGVVTENNIRTEPYFVLSETKIPRDDSRNTKYKTMFDLYKKLPVDLKLKQYYYKKLSQFDFLTNEEIDVLIRQLQPLTSGSVLHNNVEEINNPFINRFDEKEKYDSIVSVLVDDTKTPDLKFEIVNEYLPTLETLENVNDIYKTSLSHVSDTTLRAYVRNTTRTNNTIFRNTIQNFDPNAIENKLSNLVNKLKELHLDFIQPIIDFYERLITQNNGNNQELEKIYNHLNDLIFGSFWNNSGKSDILYEKYYGIESFKSIYDAFEGYNQLQEQKTNEESYYFAINNVLESKTENGARGWTPWNQLTTEDFNAFKQVVSLFTQSNSIEELKNNLTETKSYDKIILHNWIKTYYLINKSYEQWNKVYGLAKIWLKSLGDMGSSEYNDLGLNSYIRINPFITRGHSNLKPQLLYEIRSNINTLESNVQDDKKQLNLKVLKLVLFALEREFTNQPVLFKEKLTSLLEDYSWTNPILKQNEVNTLYEENKNDIDLNGTKKVDKDNWNLVRVMSDVNSWSSYSGRPTKIPELNISDNFTDRNSFIKYSGDRVEPLSQDIVDELKKEITLSYGQVSSLFIERWFDTETIISDQDYEIIESQIASALKKTFANISNKYEWFDATLFKKNRNAIKSRPTYSDTFFEFELTLNNDEDLKLLLGNDYETFKNNNFYNDFIKQSIQRLFTDKFSNWTFNQFSSEDKIVIERDYKNMLNELWIKPAHNFEVTVLNKKPNPKFSQEQVNAFRTYLNTVVRAYANIFQKNPQEFTYLYKNVKPTTIIDNLTNRDLKNNDTSSMIIKELVNVFISSDSTWTSYKDVELFNPIINKYRPRFLELKTSDISSQPENFFNKFEELWNELLNETLVQGFIQKVYKWDHVILDYYATYRILVSEYLTFSPGYEDSSEAFKKEFVKHFNKGEFRFTDRTNTEFVMTDPNSTNPLFSTLSSENINFIKYVLTNDVKEMFTTKSSQMYNDFKVDFFKIIYKYNDEQLNNIFGIASNNAIVPTTFVSSTGVVDSTFVYSVDEWYNAMRNPLFNFELVKQTFDKFVEKMKQHNIQPLSDDEINNL